MKNTFVEYPGNPPNVYNINKNKQKKEGKTREESREEQFPNNAKWIGQEKK